MMNQKHFDLDDFLPDEIIQQDLSRILWTEIAGKPIELEDKYVIVPQGTILEVVSKNYRKNLYNIGFFNYYKAQVAIGGVIQEKSGILYPKYCFATLFYKPDKTMITLDFHGTMR